MKRDVVMCEGVNLEASSGGMEWLEVWTCSKNLSDSGESSFQTPPPIHIPNKCQPMSEPDRHLQESPALRTQNRKKSQKGSFCGSAKTSPKIPLESKNASSPKV